MTTRLLAVLCLAAGLAPGLAWAQTPSAAERLEQAREQLLAQALQASTQVDVLSWIDPQGRLHEHPSMRQSVRVAALQAPWPSTAPAAAPAGQGQPRAQAPAVRDHVRESALGLAPAEGPCTSAPAGLRPTVALHTDYPLRMPPRLRERLHSDVQRLWLSASADAPWRMFWTGSQWAPGANAYEQTLVGPAAHGSPWTARLQFDLQGADTGGQARLEMSLTLHSPQAPMLVLRSQLRLPQEAPHWGRAQWGEAGWEAVQERLLAWAAVLDAQLQCARMPATVQALGAGQWQLQVGELSGVRVGDEWVLVAGQWAQGRRLDPSALDGLVVARVGQVGPHQARLDQVAGPALAPSRPGHSWSAQPLVAPMAPVAQARTGR